MAQIEASTDKMAVSETGTNSASGTTSSEEPFTKIALGTDETNVESLHSSPSSRPVVFSMIHSPGAPNAYSRIPQLEVEDMLSDTDSVYVALPSEGLRVMVVVVLVEAVSEALDEKVPLVETDVESEDDSDQLVENVELSESEAE